MKRRLAPWALILVGALAYPISVLAGGAPRFPSSAECRHPVVAGQEIEAVFGRFARADQAEALYRRVVGAGFSGTELKPDGCGFLEVAVHGIPSEDVGNGLVAEARKAGFDDVTLEQYVP